MKTPASKKHIICSLVLAGLIFAAFKLPSKHITVYMIGDSTMSIKEKRAYPETGWGMPFANFFDSTITIDNRAKNGRSTKSFIAEGLWQPVADNLKEGDYLFIQFGHNDEVKTKVTYTPEDDFKKYLLQFVTLARSKNAIPVLITPVARRKFDENGKVVPMHPIYTPLVKQVAQENHVLMIDLDQKSQDLLQELGPDRSQLLYNYLVPGEHPNYPDGKQDNTHFSELGARRIAELVLADIRTLLPDLAEHIIKPKPVAK
ncbi:rhamnogalacturonan acetylesterase [Mucilaginibacter polytrichastri]|uniref:Rhamnogalacturonan acetylesterase rhgT n=1 Tax=Mucilaginibacter polytrichastri TaxID=1302689 RepID=A0A1Q5ZYZ4_9SPHI|nr:rhamnogalacturonan acetylesterase [Mucilaginibacter polytrichastri]OKS86962.1 Rhamnogalacturonan acetylesterase rhgT [Mucilaginibacter polytrichastri]SFS85034.1 Lysophospholipase L1 [Mucilaginibacter polytrichastri]